MYKLFIEFLLLARKQAGFVLITNVPLCLLASSDRPINLCVYVCVRVRGFFLVACWYVLGVIRSLPPMCNECNTHVCLHN